MDGFEKLDVGERFMRALARLVVDCADLYEVRDADLTEEELYEITLHQLYEDPNVIADWTEGVR